MKRQAILINRNTGVPLRRQLETALREAILSGALAPGERMLSSRELQSHLGVSRNTITDALSRLHAEGLLITVRGVGTFVESQILGFSKERAPAAPLRAIPSRRAAQCISAHPLARNENGTIPFRPGLPDLTLFPFAQFKAGFSTSGWGTELLEYQRGLGLEALRRAVAERLRQTRGVACSQEQIMITAGAQAAFSLIFDVLLNPGDAVAIEEPGYPNVRSVLEASGATILPVPTDEEGIDVSRVRQSNAAVAYVTPSHQYPTGAVLSLERRLALLDWASNRKAWIVEDDYDSEFNYTAQAQPALQGLDENHRVIYVGTFSKVLSPALRVGYMVIPDALRPAFEAAHEITGAAPSTFMQSALARFIDGGHLGRHIVKMRKLYDERRRFVRAQLENGSVFKVRDTGSGLHFIAEIPSALRDVDVAAAAASQGVVLPALSQYFAGDPTANGVVVGYAATAVTDAQSAIDSIHTALSSMKSS